MGLKSSAGAEEEALVGVADDVAAPEGVGQYWKRATGGFSLGGAAPEVTLANSQ